MQANLIKATDSSKKKASTKDPLLLRTIKELEGEVQLLSLRETDFREALTKKDKMIE